MVCRILVADDSSTIQKVIKIGLAAIPNDIRAVGSMVEALKAAEMSRYDLIIADAGLPGVSAASDFLKLVDQAGGVPLVVLMGSYDSVREADLRAVGIEKIVKKPFPPGDLTRMVQELTSARSIEAQSTPQQKSSSMQPPLPFNMGAGQWGASESPLAPSEPSAASSISQSIPQAIPSTPSYGEISSFSLDDSSGPVQVPPVPEVEPGRKGRPAFGSDGSRSPSPSDRASQSRSSSSGGSSSQVSGMSAAVEAFVLNELPPLVDRAVERYCIEHFKQVAREALTAELRRLAEEKARFLVDQ